MHLERLAVRNYRAFREATLELPASGVVLIVGPNNAGKTALLSILDILAGTSGLEAFRRAGAEEPVTLLARFVLSNEDRDRLFSSSGAKHRAWIDSDAFRWIELHLVEQGGALQGEAIRAPAGGGLEGDIGRVVWQAPGNGDLKLLPLLEWFGSHEPGDELELTTILSGGVGQQLIAMTHNVLNPLQELMNGWKSSYYHFRALRTGSARSHPASATPALRPLGDNLPEVLLFHFTRQTPEWEAIRRTMGELIPDVGELVLPAEGNQVQVMFKDPHLGVRQNIKDLGTGVEQVLLTAYVGITQPAGSLIVVEEPETNLHSDAQRRLLAHVMKWSVDRQFVLSTHSPVFLDRAAGNLPVWLVQRAGGTATVKRAQLDLADVMEEIGVRLADVLSADRILVVESDSDADILRTWFADLLDDPRVVVVTGRGGDAAWHVETVRRWIDAADVLERTILFIRDRDELRAESIAELESAGVHLLPRREIENFLIDPPALAQAISKRRKEASLPLKEDLTPDMVAQLVREISEELRAQVVLKRVAQTIVPVRLLDRKAVAQLAESDPSASALVDTVKGNLPRSNVLDEISANWEKTEAAVAEAWEDYWMDLVPGADLLARLWKRFELAYDKNRDGPLVASLMESGPEVLREVLRAFVRD